MIVSKSINRRFWEVMCVGQCRNELVVCACLVSSFSSVNKTIFESYPF